MYKLTVFVPSEFEAEVLKDFDLDLQIIGIGPIESALSSYQILLNKKQKLVFLTGWAGAYPETGLNIGDVVVATQEVFADFGRKYKTHYATFPESLKVCNSCSLSHVFTEKTIQLLEDCDLTPVVGSFSTVCSATYDLNRAYFIKEKFDVIAENMEGFGVAKACEKLKVHMVEIRVISNLLSQPEKEWDKTKASEVLKKVWECLVKNWK
uniref:Nucleoside phosphorylase domain-containing protein n=1 Tax=Thermodesulfobacterium geofontis TaxID=1295609 RepID=A0A7V5XGR5_9BACT